MLCLDAQSCLTLCDPRLLCPWGLSRQECWRYIMVSIQNTTSSPLSQHINRRTLYMYIYPHPEYTNILPTTTHVYKHPSSLQRNTLEYL